MKRVLLAALLFAGAASLAAEPKGGSMNLRLTEEGGAVVQGHATLKKDAIEIETPSGTKKVPYRLVKELEEIDPEAPPPEIEITRDRATFEDRWKAIEKKPAEDAKGQGHQWTALGDWAKKRGLEAEAKKAYEKAVEVSPDDAEARRAVGQAKDADGTWQDARVVFAKKRNAVAKEPSALYDLARFAMKYGLDDEAEGALDSINAKDAFDKQLLAFLRPITNRHKQLSSIGFPLKGHWRASQDPSHHHEAKTYAVYAIDFYCEVDGKAWKNDGKELSDHHAYGKPVYCVGDGRVIGVQDEFPDNPIGKIPAGDLQLKANTVSILHSEREVSWYIHLQKGSIKMKIGQTVKKGDVVGLVGNSGASSAPHLHFTLVDGHRLSIPWRCEDWTLVAEDGSKVHVKRGRVLEGQVCEGPE